VNEKGSKHVVVKCKKALGTKAQTTISSANANQNIKGAHSKIGQKIDEQEE
jgi:hypothetical protein